MWPYLKPITWTLNLLSTNAVHEQEIAKQMARNVYLQENLSLVVLKQKNWPRFAVLRPFLLCFNLILNVRHLVCNHSTDEKSIFSHLQQHNHKVLGLFKHDFLFRLNSLHQQSTIIQREIYHILRLYIIDYYSFSSSSSTFNRPWCNWEYMQYFSKASLTFFLWKKKNCHCLGLIMLLLYLYVSLVLSPP